MSNGQRRSTNGNPTNVQWLMANGVCPSSTPFPPHFPDVHLPLAYIHAGPDFIPIRSSRPLLILL
jgi:hypothetical protein